MTRQPELLDRALANILQISNSNHELVTSCANTLDELMAEISTLMPKVILLGESTPLSARQILGPLLMAYPELRVIVVSEDTNWLHVFDKKDRLLTDQADLLDIINAE